jgi:myo-inositol-1(or 4)-monophosphatase
MHDLNTPAAVATIIKEIARDAGKLALQHFRSLASLPVEKKGHLDLVTEADRQVEDLLIARLKQAFPDDGIYGEERGELAGTSGRIWVIDPIDGTFNFVRGGDNWAISIGLFENRRPTFGVIYAPARDQMLVGGKSVPTQLNGKALLPLRPLDMSQAAMSFGIHPTVATEDRLELMRFMSDELRISFRFCGSATLSFISVALGETDGYLSLGDSTWDVMAALPILANLGVSHTIDWDNTDLSQKLRFACGGDEFVSRLQPLLQSVAAAA